MGENQSAVARAALTRFAIFGGSLVVCLAWVGNAEAAMRADYDLNNDGLIEINDLSDRFEIARTAARSTAAALVAKPVGATASISPST
jgi:hypothetical protein